MPLTRRALLSGAAALSAPVALSKADAQTSSSRMTSQRLSFTSGGRSITVDAFGAGNTQQPAIVMLHGADGLSMNTQYAVGARAIASAGYRVYLVHYLDRTGERRVSYSTLLQQFPLWLETVQDSVSWVSGQQGVDPRRIGIVGISLGAALGLTAAATDRRVRALVDYFGPYFEGALPANGKLPPTLVLHGAADRLVPVSNAGEIETMLKRSGTPYEIKIYPSQGHGFTGAAQADATARVVSFLRRYLGGRQAGNEAPLSATG